jgi:putative DNA primase/helicase
MKEQIRDESIFLRISELKNGLIQFTDSTNAMRLVKENGRDIRYNAAWKKWVVWNGKYWEMDEGGVLIHEKGLEMVRNIYCGVGVGGGINPTLFYTYIPFGCG